MNLLAKAATFNLLLLITLLSFRAVGEDFTTRSGITFKTSSVISLTESNVVLRHAGGTNQVVLSEFAEADIQTLRRLDLERRKAEVEQLRKELERQELELKNIQRSTVRPTPRTTAEPAEATAPKAVRPATPDPIPQASLASPAETDVLSLAEVVQAYRENPAAADRRFYKKRFRVKGIVASFDPSFLSRSYTVLLDSGDGTLRVACEFPYSPGWKSVRTRERGRELYAVLERGELPLSKAGDAVLVKGVCRGLHGSEIRFGPCDVVR